MLKLVKEAGLENRIQIDSAGTSAYHVGEGADSRSQATANRRGVTLPSRSRQVKIGDFSRFQYMIAMDTSNLNNLMKLCPNPEHQKRVRLLRNFDPASPRNASVPDPYYGGPDGFENVYDICQAGCKGLLKEIEESLNR